MSEENEVTKLIQPMKAVEIYSAISDVVKGQSCQDITRALRFLIDDVERKQYSELSAVQEAYKYQNAVCTGSGGLLGASTTQKDVKF